MTADGARADGVRRPPWSVVLDVPAGDGWFDLDVERGDDTGAVAAFVEHVWTRVAVLDEEGARALTERAAALVVAAREVGAVVLLLDVRAVEGVGTTTVLGEQHVTLSWYDSAPHPARLESVRAALDDPALRTAGPDGHQHLLLPGAERVHDPGTGASLTVHTVQAWVPVPGSTWTGVVSGSSTLPAGAEELLGTVGRIAASLHRGSTTAGQG